MESRNRQRLNNLLQAASRYERYLALLACLAAVVIAGVTYTLMQRAVAMNHKETILVCEFEGHAAHSHTPDCYDKGGNLVCPLPELELHIHDDGCYSETWELTCGQEEGDEHTHSEDCYESVRTLTCGKEEITEEHVHGAGCFRTVLARNSDGKIIEVEGEESDDGLVGESIDEVVEAAEEESAGAAEAPLAAAESDQAADEDSAGESTEEPAGEPAAQAMPAQTFEEDLKDDRGDVILHVTVNAPEGAFPEGTTMRVTPVYDEGVQSAIEQAVGGRDLVHVAQIQTVDITFYDADGKEIEAAVDIEVKITSGIIDKTGNSETMLVRVDNEGKADVVDTFSENELAQRKQTLGDHEVAFEVSAGSAAE